jgi:hypothetical protein
MEAHDVAFLRNSSNIEQSCQRGLTKRYKKLEIEWQILDKHLEGLSDLFSKGGR